MILSASFPRHFFSLVLTLGELLFDGWDLRDGVDGILLSDGSAWLPPSSPPSSSSSLSSDDDDESDDELGDEDDGGCDDDVFDFDDEDFDDLEGMLFPCLEV